MIGGRWSLYAIIANIYIYILNNSAKYNLFKAKMRTSSYAVAIMALRTRLPARIYIRPAYYLKISVHLAAIDPHWALLLCFFAFFFLGINTTYGAVSLFPLSSDFKLNHYTSPHIYTLCPSSWYELCLHIDFHPVQTPRHGE